MESGDIMLVMQEYFEKFKLINDDQLSVPHFFIDISGAIKTLKITSLVVQLRLHHIFY